MGDTEKSILIGWSSKDITPKRPVALRGQFYERISQYVRDPLTVTALAMQEVDEKGKEYDYSIMVSCDLVAIDKSLLVSVREKIKDKIENFDVKKIIISATHTHTGPIYSNDEDNVRVTASLGKKDNSDNDIMPPEEIFSFLVDNICDAIIEAWNSRAPGYFSPAMERAEVGFCRMAIYRDGRSVMYGDTNTADFEGLLGPNDSGVEMLFFWNIDKKLTGVLVNVSCPSQVVEHMSFISSDFWGETRKEIRKKLGDDIFIIPITGAAGDQSPRDLIRLKRKNSEANVDSLNTFSTNTDNSAPGWEMYDERGLYIIANRISKAVMDAYVEAEKSIQTFTGTMELNHTVEVVSLPIRRVSMEDYKNAKMHCKAILQNHGIDGNIDIEEWYNNSKQSAIREEMFLYYGVIKRFKMQQKQEFYKTEIHVLRLNDTIIATNPFELYLEYGMRIRARCKAKQVIIAQLACDSAGYLPTERAVRGGAYSAIVASNIVGPEGGSILVAYTVETANSLF